VHYRAVLTDSCHVSLRSTQQRCWHGRKEEGQEINASVRECARLARRALGACIQVAWTHHLLLAANCVQSPRVCGMDVKAHTNTQHTRMRLRLSRQDATSAQQRHSLLPSQGTSPMARTKQTARCVTQQQRRARLVPAFLVALTLSLLALCCYPAQQVHRWQGAPQAAGHQGGSQERASHRRREEAPPLPPGHCRVAVRSFCALAQQLRPGHLSTPRRASGAIHVMRLPDGSPRSAPRAAGAARGAQEHGTHRA